MTMLSVRVIDEIEKGPASHCFTDDNGELLIDTSPDRSEIILKGINCNPSEFIKWFLTVEESKGYYDLVSDGSDTLIDIGGSPHDFSAGKELHISFDEYFNALIETKITTANAQLDKLILDSKVKLGIGDSIEKTSLSTIDKAIEDCDSEFEELFDFEYQFTTL
ncbi:hypothetical protein [Vibrio sp. R78045]|uniref:hypothetical protein n=1 Tax=Vibrio sp. R78045 TaxID=3093868 RepID=UPI0036F285DF